MDHKRQTLLPETVRILTLSHTAPWPRALYSVQHHLSFFTLSNKISVFYASALWSALFGHTWFQGAALSAQPRGCPS